MADVIKLQDRQHRGGRKMNPDGARQDATILLFTGIRYERIDGVTLPKVSPGVSTIKPLNGSTNKH